MISCIKDVKTKQLWDVEAAIIVLSDLFSSYFSDDPKKAENNSPTWMTEVLPLQKERRAVMDTGMRLKYHRLKKKISLEELASGILTPRELKKIETGLKDPALKDLEALCKKLKIPLASKDNPIGKVLVKNFKNALLHPQNKGKIMEYYSDIQDHPLLHVDEDVELEYAIQQIRYFIITGDLDSAEDKLKEMNRFTEFMNQEQFYLFHKYNGNYHYILNDYETALQTYLMAEKIAPQAIPGSEIGDLYYSIGISATQCRETGIGNKYSHLALKIYQQEFIPKRIVECHLNLAINERRIGNFTTAKEHLKNALTIGKKLDNDILKFTTEYNYGYFYFHFQDYKLAKLHITNSLEFIPKEYTSDLLSAYCILIKCNVELEDLEEAIILVQKGEALIEGINLVLESPTNKAFREILYEFKGLVQLIKGDDDKFEYYCQLLLPILSQNGNLFEKGYYLDLLGKTYFKRGDFEKAAITFNESKQCYKDLMTVK